MNETQTGQLVNRPTFGWLRLLLPVLVNAVGSFTVFCVAFFTAWFVVAPLIFVVCCVWAWKTSDRLAKFHCGQTTSVWNQRLLRNADFSRAAILRTFLFVLELLLMLPWFPFLGIVISILRAFGFHIGWS
jgi:hypothetical protein